MTYEDVMKKLEQFGTDQTKKTFSRHGAKEPFFGVKVGDLKKHFVKDVKKDQQLVYDLYNSGNSDAMYLAGLTVKPKEMTKEQLNEWVHRAYWYMISEYTVAQVTAASLFALELAREWMRADEEMIAVAGWSAYSNYLSITRDEEVDVDEVEKLLKQVEDTIHSERNRVRYTMNNFVICAGAYCKPMHERAKEVAEAIGKVHVDVGNTACKVPLATDYIKKVEDRNAVGKKRKTCIC